MTATQRGGGPRSMGASLLDQVLAETLDPAYRQAAEARAVRDPAAPTEGPPASADTVAGRRAGQVLVALVLAVAGVLLAVTYGQASAQATGRQGVRSALVDDIKARSTSTDRLLVDLERLRAEVDRTRDSALAASTVGQEVLERLTSAQRAAAGVPVTGPGLRVTLANARSSADQDPVGRTAQQSTAGRVRDGDLQLVVNALWAAGAEAVSINGQRLGPTSTIRTAGEAILVDFRPVTNPYSVSAVGNADTLSTRFLANPEVGGLAVVSQSYGLRFEFAKETRLALPAASSAELRHARVLVPAARPSTAPTAGG